MIDAVQKIKEASFTGSDGLDYVETLVALDALKSVLEQEPILDNIRAEITGKYRIVLKDTPKDDWSIKWNECVDEVLEVIDKYKAESEE